MYKHVDRALTERGLHFHPVIGLGSGSLVEVAQRGIGFLEQNEIWRNPEMPVHFLGHSAGGLVARLILKNLKHQLPPGKVRSCLTVATPHRGARLAQICLDMPRDYRGSALVMKGLGYNLTTKVPFFTEFTRSVVEKTVGSADDLSLLPEGTRAASIVCSSSRRNFCVPLKMFYKVKAFKDFDDLSDGVVEKATQPFGTVLEEMEIDHFRQMGFFGESKRFDRMCDVIAAHFSE